MRLRHVVLFGFADSTDQLAIADVVRGFAAFQTSIAGIDALESGQNCSPEGLHRQHTHAFVLTFSNEEARDAYLTHPQHVAFADGVKPLLTSATVVDY